MTQATTTQTTVVLLGSAAAMLLAAGLLWTRVIDLGMEYHGVFGLPQQDLLAGLCAAAALMDVALLTFLTSRRGR